MHYACSAQHAVFITHPASYPNHLAVWLHAPPHPCVVLSGFVPFSSDPAIIPSIPRSNPCDAFPDAQPTLQLIISNPCATSFECLSFTHPVYLLSILVQVGPSGTPTSLPSSPPHHHSYSTTSLPIIEPLQDVLYLPSTSDPWSWFCRGRM